MNPPQALAGVTVVDLTSGVGGAYAGKLLADLGADVVLVEPADGSPLRRRPPFGAGRPDGKWFEHLSGAKRSVVPADAAALDRLVSGADVLLGDGTSPYESWLPTLLPEHVVSIDLSPWGRSGPYAGWRGSDLALWAMGGYLNITGSPERAPLWLPGSQAELHAGANAAFAALVGLYERRRHGWGQAVEVSVLESVLTAHAWLVSSWAACGQPLTRVGNDLIRMADGWAYVMRIAPNDELFVLIDRPDLAAENLTDEVTTWFANIPRIFEAVAEWAKDQTVEHIVDLGQALRVAVTPVLDAAGVMADPQLAARSWWEEGFPGQPYHLSASPSRRRGPAPRLGEHSAEVGGGPPRSASASAAGRCPAGRTTSGGPAGAGGDGQLGRAGVRALPGRPGRRRGQGGAGGPAGHPGALLGRSRPGPAAPGPPPGHVLQRDEPGEAGRLPGPGPPRRVGRRSSAWWSGPTC